MRILADVPSNDADGRRQRPARIVQKIWLRHAACADWRADHLVNGPAAQLALASLVPIRDRVGWVIQGVERVGRQRARRDAGRAQPGGLPVADPVRNPWAYTPASREHSARGEINPYSVDPPNWQERLDRGELGAVAWFRHPLTPPVLDQEVGPRSRFGQPRLLTGSSARVLLPCPSCHKNVQTTDRKLLVQLSQWRDEGRDTLSL